MDDILDALDLHDEQRMFERHSIVFPARYSVGAEVYHGTICDIGPGGALLEVEQTLSPGTGIVLMVDAQPPLQLPAVVRHTRASGAKQKSGIEFTHRTREMEEGIQELIHAHFWQDR
jgi:hypothetical protein